MGDMKNVLEKQVDRRRTLQVLGIGLAGTVLLPACKKEEAAAPAPKPAPAPAAPAAAPAAPAGEPTAAAPAAAKPEGDLNCETAAPIDEASKGLRAAFQYKEKSAEAGKNCAGCAQYIAGKYGGCGGCKLFTGAVNPNGHCISWVPIAAAK
jgi:hypothetical protein